MSMRRIGGGELFVLESGRPLEEIFELDPDEGAVVFRYADSWHLLASPELTELYREWSLGADLEDLLGDRTEAITVPLGTQPQRPAVVLDAAGEVSGAWVAEAAGEHAESRPLPLRGAPQRRSGSGGGEPPPPLGGDGARDEDVETIRRTPHLDAPTELDKAPGTEFTVSVYVDTKELRAGEAGEGLELKLPPDVDSVEVGVLLYLIGPFELADGSEYRVLTISRDEEESPKLEFKVRVVGEQSPGRVAISALFTLRGRSCGHVARVWEWETNAAKAPLLEAESQAPVSMPLHVKGDQPDLSIFITAPIKDGVHFQSAVQAPTLLGYEKPTAPEEFALPSQGYDFMKTLLKALSDEKRTADERFQALYAIGLEAWEAAPKNVQDVLWKMVDAGKPPKTVNIASVEPILPWELMIPRRLDGGQPDELGPLGVEFAIGRWTRADSQSPSPHLRVDHSFVIAPTYASRPLDFRPELELIEQKLFGERVQPATAEDLNRRFREDKAALLHFVCHGAAGIDDDDAIELDSSKLLRAKEVETRKGFKALCRAAHPVVFLNSCSTGQLVPSLAGGAGFPRSFGNVGANAIIAPLWPVDDELARKVALELYDEALKPDSKPIAEILRGIRRRGYEEEDADTFAAYCFFGDPQARLEVAEPAADR